MYKIIVPTEKDLKNWGSLACISMKDRHKMLINAPVGCVDKVIETLDCEIRKQRLHDALRDAGGNVKAVAAKFGVSKTTIYNRCEKLKINCKKYNGGM